MKIAAAVTAGFACAALAAAQELPLRVWGVRDGLVQSRVNDIVRDADGYVWFATWEGVSRFDGRRFVNYGPREGLPNPLVWCAAQAPDGRIWFGTHGGGLAWVEEHAERGHAALASIAPGPTNAEQRVFEIAFDSGARMWLVTAAGVYVAEPTAPERLKFELVEELGPAWFGRPLADARTGLWFVGLDSVAHCRGRAVERWTLPDEGDLGELRAVTPRRAGGCWVAQVRSLHIVDLPLEPGAAPRRRRVDFGLDANSSLYSVREDPAGRVWVGTSHGLARLECAADGSVSDVRWFGADQGLPDDWVHSLTYDDRGGLWIGTHHGGAAFLPDVGIERFTQHSGLGDGNVVQIHGDAGGSLIVSTEVAGLFELEHGRARQIPLTDRPPFDRIQQHLERDRAGDWWFATTAGVWRVPGPEFDLARARLVGPDAGLPQSATLVRGLDPLGRVVVSTSDGSLLAAELGSARFQPLPCGLKNDNATDVVFQPGGTVWIATHEQAWRWRNGDLLQVQACPEGNRELQPRALFLDSRGWLWIGRRFGGVAYTREPSAAAPRFECLTTRDDLASDTVFAIAEDHDGALYFGTGRGVDRYRPADGAFEHIGPSEGLAGEWVAGLYVDAHGDIWVAASGGVSHITPQERVEPRVPPRVRFTRCVVAGEELALPAAGAFDVAPLEVGARDSRLAFEFVAVDPVDGERLRYQTRLDGLDADWSEPSRELGARYGQLAPRDYCFRVRSVESSGGLASAPSSITIRVLPPVWQRAWFLALVGLALGGAGWGLHRVRLARALALERIRTQIATDLHDDLGAGLAQIAILSEVAKRAQADEARDVMGEVAELARALRSSMSDLVWAVDPRRDTLADLVSRMRHFASDVLEGDGLALDFRTPPEDELAGLELAPDRRRGLYFAFKEAVTNVARHARAARVEIELAHTGGRLRLIVRDDGQGFDPVQRREGNGLENLRRRAEQLGGELLVDSGVGRGTRVELDCRL